MIASSEIESLGTLNTTFLDLFHARLTGYSFGDKQGYRKNDEITKRSSLLHNVKQ